MIDFSDRLQIISEVVDSKKGLDPTILDLRGLSSELDAFFICHGTSTRHVRALADAIEEKLIEIKEKPLFVEGMSEGTWVLMDCGDVGVHIFDEKVRDYYRLEELWSHAPVFDVKALGSAPNSIS
ncbi:MAG: ribosome silencing factor [Nitrospinaceae bacterium]|nr:ribosome silencing factor [Nitrospinaceae bacterium]MBT3435222.1 ribosome silencing factor [Nitrospinaceae bacterium]MBT3821873.1 ribosome silencing factor [Nitrospinaceae bacterium]MBT4094808.1 ribosome silencing factor [Nitrospinaceae bacterium]MBT4429177.1 ribosome silencing factor [Nitrospinaceae bacterium]